VGKTHAARWIASELGRPVYLIDGAELASMWYGQTEAQLRSRLEAAASERAGAVVVWDEAEALLGERGHSALGVEHRVVTQMLAALDGFLQRGERMIVILTTNRADQMDVALKRHLRAQTVAFGRPDAPRTRALFELYLRELPLADGDARGLAREAALAIFGEPEPLAEAVLRDGTRLPIARSACVSGALARAACERARRIAFARHVKRGANGAPAAVAGEDLHAALDEQLAALAGSLTAENLARMVSLPARAAGAVVALERRNGSERRRFVGETRADVPPRTAGDGRAIHAA
jgi:SpoVK/Ycf46/Vps4 family AAA+-type ATPase